MSNQRFTPAQRKEIESLRSLYPESFEVVSREVTRGDVLVKYRQYDQRGGAEQRRWVGRDGATWELK